MSEPVINSISDQSFNAPFAAAGCSCQPIPALTEVEIAIDAEIGSKISKSGQAFPIRLTRPIEIGGRVVVAAGATGVGEVVHAKKGSGSGAPGELVLAARYLDVGSRRLPLRSLHWGGVGKDRIGDVNRLAVASALSPVPVALIGFLIAGGETVVAKGSPAAARTAAEFLFETARAPDGLPTPTPVPVPANIGGETK